MIDNSEIGPSAVEAITIDVIDFPRIAGPEIENEAMEIERLLGPPMADDAVGIVSCASRFGAPAVGKDPVRIAVIDPGVQSATKGDKQHSWLQSVTASPSWRTLRLVIPSPPGPDGEIERT